MVVGIEIRSKRQSTCALRPFEALLRLDAHSWTHPEGWRDWPFEAPATSRMRERCQFLRDVAEAFQDLRHERIPAEVFSHGSHQADVQGVRGGLRARGPVRLRALLRTARGRLRARHPGRRARAQAHPGWAAEHLGLYPLPAPPGAPPAPAPPP